MESCPDQLMSSSVVKKSGDLFPGSEDIVLSTHSTQDLGTSMCHMSRSMCACRVPLTILTLHGRTFLKHEHLPFPMVIHSMLLDGRKEGYCHDCRT